MTDRFVAVLSRPPEPAWAPPGVAGGALRVAMLEDVYETVAGLRGVHVALALVPPDQGDARAVTWPATPVVTAGRSDDAGEVLAVLSQVMALPGGDAAPDDRAVALVSGDAPDLPGMVVGKLFRSLGTAEIAVCPAAGGGLVAIATRAPVPEWLVAAATGLDHTDALARLAAAAPRRSALGVSPGWHRIRDAADLGRLDPGLDSWESTRAVLRR